jgi:hypothetical protein
MNRTDLDKETLAKLAEIDAASKKTIRCWWIVLGGSVLLLAALLVAAVLFSGCVAHSGGQIVLGGGQGHGTNAPWLFAAAAPGGVVTVAGRHANSSAETKTALGVAKSNWWKWLLAGILACIVIYAVWYFVFSPNHISIARAAVKVATGL